MYTGKDEVSRLVVGVVCSTESCLEEVLSDRGRLVQREVSWYFSGASPWESWFMNREAVSG